MRINWLGVLISAVVIVALRYLWNAHFAGADWSHLVGNAIGQAQSSPNVAGLELVNAVVLSLGLAWLVGLNGRSLPVGLGAGLAAGVMFGLTSASEGVIHGAPLKSLINDGGVVVLAYTLGGAIIGALAPQPARKAKFDWGSEAAAETHH
jgi:hypothetical protein